MSMTNGGRERKGWRKRIVMRRKKRQKLTITALRKRRQAQNEEQNATGGGRASGRCRGRTANEWSANVGAKTRMLFMLSWPKETIILATQGTSLRGFSAIIKESLAVTEHQGETTPRRHSEPSSSAALTSQDFFLFFFWGEARQELQRWTLFWVVFKTAIVWKQKKLRVQKHSLIVRLFTRLPRVVLGYNVITSGIEGLSYRQMNVREN